MVFKRRLRQIEYPYIEDVIYNLKKILENAAKRSVKGHFTDLLAIFLNIVTNLLLGSEKPSLFKLSNSSYFI